MLDTRLVSVVAAIGTLCSNPWNNHADCSNCPSGSSSHQASAGMSSSRSKWQPASASAADGTNTTSRVTSTSLNALDTAGASRRTSRPTTRLRASTSKLYSANVRTASATTSASTTHV